MKIGILTGGGDCPGLNPVIRAIVRKGRNFYGYEFLGILNGWAGLLNIETKPLDLAAVSGILQRGGTILGTSRTNPYKKENGAQIVAENYRRLELDALIVIGGEDTLGVANKLTKEKLGMNLVGVPKTIDNDLSATDYTFGFDTAVNIAMEAIDRLHSTAESHHRVMVVEVMGRHAGWIAMHAGLAGGADAILIPEEPFSIEEVCDIVKNRRARGKYFSIIVVAEGAKPKEGELATQEKELDAFGHVRLGGIGELLSREIEKRTGHETRTTTLGHIQRGGSPTAFDRVLGTRFGVAAIDLIKAKKFGRMVSLRGNEIVDVALEEAVKELKTVDKKFYELGKVFSG